MRKIHVFFSVIALLLAQQALALDTTTNATTTTPAATTTTTTGTTTTMTDELKQCQTIAKACNDAGFTKGGPAGKMLFKDCVKPILYGKTVAGVTTDPNDVKACKKLRIQHLEKKLNDLNAVSYK